MRRRQRESFIDYVGRSGFDNYDEYLELAGADRLIPEMPRKSLGIEPPSHTVT